jgi:hypothetical protein
MRYISGDLKIDFNSKLAASKTVDEFIEHEKHLGLSDEDLREAHALCVAEQQSKQADTTDVATTPVIEGEKEPEAVVDNPDEEGKAAKKRNQQN